MKQTFILFCSNTVSQKCQPSELEMKPEDEEIVLIHIDGDLSKLITAEWQLLPFKKVKCIEYFKKILFYNIGEPKS